MCTPPENELIYTTDLETHRGRLIPQFKPHVKNDQTLNDITDHRIKHPPRSKTTSRSPKTKIHVKHKRQRNDDRESKFASVTPTRYT